MITAIIGHRGTGKSTFLERLRFYLNQQEGIHFADLDTEIEKKIGKSIGELFQIHGESYFRDMERQIFAEFLQQSYPRSYIVLGAGFDLSVIPEHVQVLWVRRDSDLEGRIFLDRPRLNQSTTPLQEYQERALLREISYAARADEIYVMPPGDFSQKHLAMQAEKSILLHQMKDLHGCLTVLPEHFRSEKSWQVFQEQFATSGLDYFELRDDLLTLEQMQKFMLDLPSAPFIFSLRKVERTEAEQVAFEELVSKSQWVDWAWEVGDFEKFKHLIPKEKLIGSLHRAEDFEVWMETASNYAHLKFAPLVENFKMLWRCHQWQQLSPKTRSFLPRSQNGQWYWYRLVQKGKQLINFLRDGTGSSGDQPTLWQWLVRQDSEVFAAVLGHPVLHSFTPMEHSDFFAKTYVSVYSIQVMTDEFETALPLLKELGLKYAAVTSPLKEKAAKICLSELKAINTLVLNNDIWSGTNTDDAGFVALLEGIGMIAPLQSEIAVWGGGGTLDMIAKSLPGARYFSSRTGELRSEEGDVLAAPKVVVWAAPRTSDTIYPPDSWNPQWVLDLNYKEDSMGKEYAQKCRCSYKSGLEMFLEQARGQRMFWKKQEGL